MIQYSILQINLERDKDGYSFWSSTSILGHANAEFPPPKFIYDEIYHGEQNSFDP